jgi:hypothetical protein
VWTSASFGSLTDLLAFLNGRRLVPDAFHVVVARDDEGVQLFCVLYQEPQDKDAVGQAVQEAELLPVVEGAQADEAAAAVVAAEEILQGKDEE